MNRTFLFVISFLYLLFFFYYFNTIYLNNKKEKFFGLYNTISLSPNYFLENNNNIVLFTMYNISKRNKMTNDILNYYN